ncbi:DUF4230 domain-containing protein [Bergeyella porcorum]|uniref:DUF4230 domain-containing protein n=1 Tax=Bergeyella porcorum TaxID=1735111 RepID=UPI0035ECE880
MKNRSIVVGFLAGVLLMGVSFFVIKKLTSKDESMRNDVYIITNQIKRMNKMVVVEQDFSVMQKTKMTTQLLGGLLPDTEKQIITFTKTNAQVSYDLNQMKLEVDSIGKKLIIRELPNAEIKIIPSVEIQSIDDSFLNRISEQDIKRIQDNAKQNAIKSVDETRLRNEGRQQLIENLNQIFILAKALNYTIEDKTGEIDMKKL